jgi:DNA topoisomerase-1
VENFKDIFDFQYTARLEEELDEIEEGKELWTDALAEFYKKFEKDLHYAEKHMENVKRMEKATDQLCERCGSPLVIKWGKHGSFYACSAYDKTNPESCTFTKENPIDLPDLDSADLQETTQEEYCENCGRPMVLKRGRFGQFMACTGYPDCKTTRRLDQGKKIPDIPLDEKCPQCGRNLLIRHGRFGEFTSCSGYPDCKYVKQTLVGVKCPECKEGDIAEKKARRGNIFYGCTNYPKCEFTCAFKPVDEGCPSCKSPYLLEKTLKDGVYLVCPNNRRTTTEEPKRRGKKKKEGAEPTVKCDFSRLLSVQQPAADGSQLSQRAGQPWEQGEFLCSPSGGLLGDGGVTGGARCAECGSGLRHHAGNVLRVRPREALPANAAGKDKFARLSDEHGEGCGRHRGKPRPRGASSGAHPGHGRGRCKGRPCETVVRVQSAVRPVSGQFGYFRN